VCESPKNEPEPSGAPERILMKSSLTPGLPV